MVPWLNTHGADTIPSALLGMRLSAVLLTVLTLVQQQGTSTPRFSPSVYELLVGRTPFADDNQSRIFQRVLGADKFLATPAVWPKGFDPDAKDLIKQMLMTSAARRLALTRRRPGWPSRPAGGAPRGR